jgi:hypothetical protein
VKNKTGFLSLGIDNIKMDQIIVNYNVHGIILQKTGKKFRSQNTGIESWVEQTCRPIMIQRLPGRGGPGRGRQ